MMNVAIVQVIDEALFDKVAAGAKASPRKRLNYNFHGNPQANPHRFLNVLLEGTYIRPHRHLNPPKSEAFLVLEGSAEVILFDDEGKITGRHRLGESGAGGKVWGVDLAPGMWHTIRALSKRVICYEVKPGPWEAASDKEFAEWAPKEGDPGAAEFLQRLEANC